MRKLLFIAMATFCAACAEEVDAPVVELDNMPPLPDEQSGDGLRREDTTYASAPSVCDLLPDDDSACAHACDPDALTAYIPPGTCATFDCPLSDGTVYRIGGCAP